MKNFLPVFLIIIFSLCCCESEDDYIITPEYSSGIKNIKHNLDKEKIDLFEAYIEATKYLENQNKESKSYNESMSFLNEIYTNIDQKTNENFKAKKYEEALKYALSLKTLNKESSIPLKEIYIKLSEYADASSDSFTSLDIKEVMGEQLLLHDDQIYKLLKIHAMNKSRGVFLYQFDKFTKLYPDLLQKYPDLLNLKETIANLKDLNLEELMKSVVLVIMDKGMNAKQGMKYYDKSIGSGFFIDNNGYILTNHHVIADHVDPKYEGYSAVKVITRDKPEGPPIPARVIGYDKVFDIALLKIPVKNKNYLVLGRSTDMAVGDKIYTIGNPLGIQFTVTSGIISNKEIDAFQLGRCFMIDAAINPGNSGGPLIDDRGQVVGIVFAGAPNYEGINFVIPFQWVRKTITALYKGGEVERCWIGAGLYNDNEKVYFYYILPNGPAYKSSINVEDRLVKIDGIEIKSVEHAQSVLAWRKFPMLIEIEVERKGKILKKIVRLEKRPYLPVETAFNKDIEANLVKLVFGLGLEYYDKKYFSNKYVTKKIYKSIFTSIYNIDLNIGEGDPVTVFDMKFLGKEKLVKLTIRYKQRDFGVVDRIVTIVSPAAINSVI